MQNFRTKRLRAACLALALGLFAWANGSGAQKVAIDSFYDCKLVASKQDFAGGFTAPPTINAAGKVLFSGIDATGLIQTLAVGSGDLDGSGNPIIDLVAETKLVGTQPGAFTSLGTAFLDDTDGVTFFATVDDSMGGMGGYASGIFRRSALDGLGGATTYLVYTPDGSYNVGDLTAANNLGEFLFGGIRADGAVGVFDSGGAFFIDTATETSIYGSAVLHPYRGDGAVIAHRQDISDNTVYLEGFAVDDRVSGTSIGGHSASWVSYINEPFGQWQLRVGSSLGNVTYADPLVDSFVFGSIPGQTSANDYLEVVLARASGGRPIWADGSEIHQIYCLSYPTGVFTTNFSISERAINNNGQIAIRMDAGVSDELIVRADPITHARPVSCTGLADGIACDDGVDASVAYCESEVCTDVPEPSVAAGLLAGLFALVGGRVRAYLQRS